MLLNRKIASLSSGMQTKIKLYGYRRFFMKQIVGVFIVELTIAFALFRTFGTVLAISKIYKILPKDQPVSALTIMQPAKQCLNSVNPQAGNVLCY